MSVALRLAVRSLATRPVRSAVLAWGFGFGIAVMAALLGVGDVILDQARSPGLVGGGDVVVSGASGSVTSARFLSANLLASRETGGRIRAISPSTKAIVYLEHAGSVVAVRVRGGVPSLEKAVGDPETSQVASWTDTPGDARWTSPDPSDVLRGLDRFHPIPETTLGPEFADSWAEWLYFNGRTADGSARFYLTFLVGAPEHAGSQGEASRLPGSGEAHDDGKSREHGDAGMSYTSAAWAHPERVAPRRGEGQRLRRALVRLQLDRDSAHESYSLGALVREAELLAGAPDLEIGPCRVRLDGLTYRIHLDLPAEDSVSDRTGAALSRRTPPPARRSGRTARAEIALEAVPGGAMPPHTLRGAGGWVSGYVVPVLSGALSGAIEIGGERLSLEGAAGYHDHNWGFWRGVTWQWGQVASGGLSFVFGRVRPPAEAADPARVPGFLGVLGPSGLTGFSTDVAIEAEGDGSGAPRTVRVRARGARLALDFELDVEESLSTRLNAPLSDRPSLAAPAPTAAATTPREPRVNARDAARGGGPLTFLQLRGAYHVSGTLDGRPIAFTAPGAAETFRGEFSSALGPR